MTTAEQNRPAIHDLRKSIDDYIGKLSEGHRMHRKIRFLLDVRGLFVLSKIQGDYVEFGTYRGEMMYAAAGILSPHISRYVGLDTFAGLPVPESGDNNTYVFGTEGAMSSPRDTVEQMMEGFDYSLIEGDFRTEEIKNEFRSTVSSISLLSIDCNWPSSVEAAFDMSAPYLKTGTVLYLDDYFVGTATKNFNDPIMQRITDGYGIRFAEFMTYPPFARAFLIEKD